MRFWDLAWLRRERSGPAQAMSQVLLDGKKNPATAFHRWWSLRIFYVEQLTALMGHWEQRISGPHSSTSPSLP